MKRRPFISKFMCYTCLSGVLVSCKELPKEVEITEQRELTQYDDPTVFKTGYDRIIAKTQPLEWRRVNGTEFRVLNYAAGESTEIAVGIVGAGGLLANFNRWEREYGAQNEEVMTSLSGLQRVIMMGREAYMIQLKGFFQKKVAGQLMKFEGWSTTGVICDVGEGVLVTVKMMGPEAEVVAQQDNFMDFLQNLKINPIQEPSERSKKGLKIEEVKSGY